MGHAFARAHQSWIEKHHQAAKALYIIELKEGAPLPLSGDKEALTLRLISTPKKKAHWHFSHDILTLQIPKNNAEEEKLHFGTTTN